MVGAGAGLAVGQSVAGRAGQEIAQSPTASRIGARRPAEPLAPGELPNRPGRPLPTRQLRPLVILNEWWMTLAAYPLSRWAGPRRRGRCTGVSANSASLPT